MTNNTRLQLRTSKYREIVEIGGEKGGRRCRRERPQRQTYEDELTGGERWQYFCRQTGSATAFHKKACKKKLQ